MIRSTVSRFAAVVVIGGLAVAAEPPNAGELAGLKAREAELRTAYDLGKSVEKRWEWIEALAQVAHGEVELERHEEALAPYQKAIEVLPAAALHEEPELVAFLHDGLGRALQNCGKYRDAEIHLAKGLQIRAALPGGEVELGISEGHLGHLQLVRGRYAEAERLFQSALEHTPEDQHGFLALRHDCFGRYYLAIRAHQLAMGAFERALQHAKVGAEADDSLLLDLRASHALCTFRSGDPDRALREIAALLAVESDHPEAPLRRAGLLDLRGTVRAGAGQFEEAANDIEGGLELVARIKGEAHLAVAPYLTNLGAVRLRAGHPELALPPLERALPILLASVEAHHQTVVELRYLLASCHLELADREGARKAVIEARAAADALMSVLIADGSERELLNFRQQVDLHSIVCQLGDPALIAQSLLNGKGRIMESVLDRRTGTRDGNVKLQDLRNHLDQLLFDNPHANAARIANLQKEIRALSGGPRPAGPSPERVTWQQLRNRLPADSVYVDCVRYRPRDGEGDEARYGAVVIAPQREPVWVALAAEKMMGRLDLLHRSLESRANIIRKGEGQAGVPMVPLLTDLYKSFWQPIARVLPVGTRQVVFCPEGRMHHLPYAVLRNPMGGFLCEELPALRLVDSGRVTVRATASPVGDQTSWAVLGLSDFAPYRNKIKLGAQLWSPRWAEKLENLSDLPTVEDELTTLRRLAPEGSRFFLNHEAVASALRRLPAPPAVLHLASHGFHIPLGGSDDLAADPSALYENGVLLALAPGDDGILFPEEIAALDLAGTKLVTLSTCRSALGRTVSGEGLLGLRRGFTKAGARNILASLWEIPDKSTAEFMKNFYTAIAKGTAPDQALWKLQSEQFGRLRAAQRAGAELETAILSIGAFVLTSSGG